MNQHAARPYACHDTTELERHERGERIAKRVFFCLIPFCVAAVMYVAECGL